VSFFDSQSRGARATLLLLGALLTTAGVAHADPELPPDMQDASSTDKGKSESGDKDKDKEPKEKESAGSKKSNLVGRVSSEVSFYTDSEAVTVVTPTIGASLENPLSEWSVGAHYLVDAVSAASVDIVATASRRWREVRHAADAEAAYKIGSVGLGASGSFSVEPDYVGWGAGGTVSIDLFQKNATLLAGYSFGHDVRGRSDTPFSVFSHLTLTHSVNGALTVLVNRDTIFSMVADAIIENGDTSKPYRYIPMFAPSVANQIPVGASIDVVNADRLQVRPLEQLPLQRDRFAGTVRLAHRFSSSTVRISERFYRDTWGLTASSTDARYIFDAGSRVSIWPHARLHLQTPVAFWQRAYTAGLSSGGNWEVPALRTGDRELGPLRGLTGGGGIQIRIGPDSSPADFTLNLQGEAVWTTYLNDLYITNRVSGLGVVAMEAVFE
jgi:Protein of unknown function (DUF3570)